MKNLILLFYLLALAACNLTQDVEIELPEYDSQPVVECYLEPGKPMRMLLTNSYGFFDPFALDSSFLQKTLLEGAVVTIRYDGREDTLYNRLSFDLSPFKFYNYSGNFLVPDVPGMRFDLKVVLPDGGTITGNTTMLPRVPIDSVRVQWNPDADSLARILTYIRDDSGQENFYRRMLSYGSLDSVPDQDFLVTDRFSQTELIAFGTGYDRKEGDIVINTFFHIEKAHYDYVESVQLAVAGSLNPFAQPSPIKSNVRGTANPLGIFTCLVYDRDTTVVMR